MVRARFRFYGKFPNLMKAPPYLRDKAMPAVVEKLTIIAQEEAPKRRGFGSPKSIVSRIKGSVDSGDVGHVKALAPHAHLIEFGVNPHSLAPGSGKRKWVKSRNPHKSMLIPGTGWRRANKYGPAYFPWHGGHGANPFMERTEERGPAVAEKILEKLGMEALEQCLERLDLG